MMKASATLKTEHAGKYLAQLSKHFEHKVEVSWTPDHSECRFICGTATLDANDDALRITVTSPEKDGLIETQSVVERHLVRFAFREDPPPLSWQDAEPRQGKAS